MLTLGNRYRLKWRINCCTAGAADEQEAYVTITKIERGRVFGTCDGGARLEYLPESAILDIHLTTV